MLFALLGERALLGNKPPQFHVEVLANSGVSLIAIIINLDVMLARRKMKLIELSDAVGISLPNLSILKTGKAKAIRLSTLDSICQVLQCQPGDILEFRDSDKKPKP